MGRHCYISGFTIPRIVVSARLVRQELRSPRLSSFSLPCTTACNTRNSDTDREDRKSLCLRHRQARFDKCQKGLGDVSHSAHTTRGTEAPPALECSRNRNRDCSENCLALGI